MNDEVLEIDTDSNSDPCMNQGSKRKGKTYELGSSSRHPTKQRRVVIDLGTPNPTLNKKDKGKGLVSGEVEKKPLKRKKKDVKVDEGERAEPAITNLIRNLNVIRTRTSPKSLFESLFFCSDAKKAVIRDLGFGSLINMKLDSLPSRMGFYVVDNLDTESMCLRLGERNIQITCESISEILGLKNEGVDLLAEMDLDGDQCVAFNWKTNLGKKILRPNS